MSDETILEVKDLKVHFPLRNGAVVHAVDGVSFELKNGMAFGLVGESGSGKSTTALACARLVKATAGEIFLKGTNILDLDGEDMRQMRRFTQIIFQDPYASLNPRERAGAIVGRPLDLMRVGKPQERRKRVAELFEIVGLRPEQQELFPHQFSGGQRQRIGIARALATQPELVICDEPVSALDVAIQAQILNLLNRLKKDFGLTYLFISHDLAIVQYICDVIAVMYLGQIIEIGTKSELYGNPLHPYTNALISAVPSVENLGKADKGHVRLRGEPPSPISPPVGCRFAGRCSFALDSCKKSAPRLTRIKGEHMVACHRINSDGKLV
ncbi:ATP-binding cassette domain-containing protein [Pelagibius litoralis]|uniref:ATP-binding cassette domain-containing protein n=1 Tax=Pelagibius litoralis TaxID=374515 RepID=A0A967EZN5_9PROT|nr:oligopeptide/dipeptide ABC transporter ATP-binding protein [Pelagibius litoralis]NIA70391.1 ATP-binding cassette domain-containing protein [Pelagibius litoralis]